MDKFIAAIILCGLYILSYNCIIAVPSICFVLGWFIFLTSMLNDIIDHLVIRNRIKEEFDEYMDSQKND